MRGLGAGHTLGDQPRHARGGIEQRPARAASVDDDANAFDGERGFGNGSRQHDLPPRPHGRNGGLLRLEVQRTEERGQGAVAWQSRAQKRFHPPDLALTGKEDQCRTGGLRKRPERQIRHCILQPLLAHRLVEPARHHLKTAALGGDDGGRHQCSHRGGIECGGHGDEKQIVPQGTRDFEAKREAKIGVERAFVKFVKDHRADARQIRIVLQHAGQDPLGDDLNAGVFRHRRSAAHPKTDGLASLFAKAFGHARSGGAGGKAARLQHQDAALGQASVEHRQRHARRLARTGGRLQHHAAGLAQGGDHVRQDGVDGQGEISVGHGAVIGQSRRRAKGGDGQFRAAPAKVGA